jgi:thiosulfate/3-mercaptopyruvate sulfurtransferase
MRAWLLSLGLVVLAVPAVDGGGQDAKYGRPELLIEAGDLAKPEVSKQFRILDARPFLDYARGHIPGAEGVDAAAWAKKFTAEPANAQVWGKLIGGLGLDPNKHKVVVYADDVRDAARVWWILRYWGFQDVRLVNGGWPAWVAAKHPVEKDVVVTVPTAVKLTAHPEVLATRDDVLEALKKAGTGIVDARSAGEFCGDTKLAKRGGAIPGAKHLEWSDLIDAQTKRFKSAETLAKLFKDAGVSLERPNITYCQSGGRAAVMAFGLELMGAKNVRNYYRSWAEWGNSADTPVEKKK